MVRVANIDPCVALTKLFLQESTSEGVDIKAMAYHSRQVLLMRHEQEKYLDKILKRNNGDAHILEDKVIRGHIDQSKGNEVIFVLVAMPVEEVGRDHDFDWAVIEPSSYRSFVQMAGRKAVSEPNIAIMQYNYRALKTKGEKIAFQYPTIKKNLMI